MGTPVRPAPVKLFTGVLYSDCSVLPAVKQTLESQFGPVDYSSDAFVFDWTDYYQNEMGKNIQRRFWSFDRLIDPGRLAGIKRFTNRVEFSFACGPSARRVNLDPGYLDFYKLVLASVKERAQKIYLSGGVYADPTLYYRKGKWYSYEWSLPDFKLPVYYMIFQAIRDLYRQNMRRLKPGDTNFIGCGDAGDVFEQE